MGTDYQASFASVGVFLETNGSQLTGSCPLCNDTGEHLYANPETGLWDCKSCEEKGNFYDLLRYLHEASLISTTAKDYLDLSKDRGIPVQFLRMFGLVKLTTTGNWAAPAYNTKGKLANIYNYAKLKGSDKPRFISAKGCKLHPFGTKLFPVSANKHTKSHTVWVCEGIWDAAALLSIFGSLRQQKKGPLAIDGLIRTKGCRDCRFKSPEKCALCMEGSHTLLSTNSVLALPGANVFDEEWAYYLAGCDVRLVFDNDHPKKNKRGKITKAGWDGMLRTIKILEGLPVEERPASVHRLRWGPKCYDPDLKSGMDVRDLLQESGPSGALRFILDRSEEVTLALPGEKKNTKGKSSKEAEVAKPPEESENLIEPKECHSYQVLLNAYKNALHVTAPFEHTLATMLAVIASTTLGGDQLWLRIIGPPGSGKSTLAEAVSPSRYIFARSRFTGLHSGFSDPNDPESDASIIPFINNRTMIVKDADTLMQSSTAAKTLSELRDIYDGTSRAQYLNKKSNVYDNIKTTFVLCGTDPLRTIDRSVLGERFLDCEILGSTSQVAFLDRAVSNTVSRIQGSLPGANVEAHDDTTMHLLKRITVGFVEHLKAQVANLRTIPQISPGSTSRIKALGQVLAAMRARVHREKGELAYRPRIELATRIVSQLSKLAICLSIVFGQRKIGDEIMGHLSAAVLDSAVGFQFEIAKLLLQESNGSTTSQIAIDINLSETAVRNWLHDMQELGIISRNSRPNRSGVRGRFIHYWAVSDELKTIWKKASL